MLADLTPAERAVLGGATPDEATLAALVARGWARTQRHMTAAGSTWWWTLDGQAARNALRCVAPA